MSGKGHHRKSKNYQGGKSTLPVIPFRDLHPLRAHRASEAFLLSCLITEAWGGWLALAGQLKEAEVDAALEIVRKMMPQAIKGLEREADEEANDEEDDDHLVVTVLWATIDWICRLELPDTEPEIWEGPPLASRLRDRPLTPKRRDLAPPRVGA